MGIEKWPLPQNMIIPPREEKLKKEIARLKERPAIREAYRLLEEKLPEKYADGLPYHGVSHTDDVMHEALRFASFYDEGTLPKHDRELLGIAAAFHDTGFIEQYDENEEIGANLAEKHMKELGYSEHNISRVKRAILGTRVGFKDGKFVQLLEDKDVIAQILADADIANLGRNDFFEKEKDIFRERVLVGKAKHTSEEREKSKEIALIMLSTHEWQSEPGRVFLGEKQKENAEKLSKELEKEAA